MRSKRKTSRRPAAKVLPSFASRDSLQDLQDQIDLELERGNKLEASKPQRSHFETQEQFEEALGYWMSHQGRVLAARDLAVKK